MAIGYREAELEAVGLTRKDRVPKLEESLALMKQLWTGEEVTFAGQYAQVTKLRMGLTPVQKPHPPIVMGCQSSATARAARLTDGVFFGPQVAGRTSASSSIPTGRRAPKPDSPRRACSGLAGVAAR